MAVKSGFFIAGVVLAVVAIAVCGLALALNFISRQNEFGEIVDVLGNPMRRQSSAGALDGDLSRHGLLQTVSNVSTFVVGGAAAYCL